ncbi:hypothetical protein LAZ67_11001855 [Cordylochernes scorpioides]|uniref:Uncharacterized protein n=1 Tax=Cordylochernes scorpioides TaxID=51811 RepID=A0ABY6L0I8_9ARAC|nr:hypothetical protein LAZ67_11001855 [Cordylochernes scorpioides]
MYRCFPGHRTLLISHQSSTSGTSLDAVCMPCHSRVQKTNCGKWLRGEWRAIPQDAIRTLIDSLPKRVAAYIAISRQDLITVSRQDNQNEGHHSEEGKKTVQIEKRERTKMEEQTNQSNDTAEPSVPKQEKTFEEEETSTPQGTSTNPLTQIADALSKLLVARSPREIDVSTYDSAFEAQSFFDNFDAQADRAELTYTDRLRKLPCYLQGKPLQYF